MIGYKVVLKELNCEDLDCIGKGSFACVYKCKSFSEVCAYKIINTKNLNLDIEKLEREFSILRDLNKRYKNIQCIVKMYCKYLRDDFLIFKMEYIRGLVCFFLSAYFIIIYFFIKSLEEIFYLNGIICKVNENLIKKICKESSLFIYLFIYLI
jgi:serine/threonine protein kinase